MMDISGYANYNDYWMAKTNGGTKGLEIGNTGSSDTFYSTALFTPETVELDTSKKDTYLKSADYSKFEEMIANGESIAIDMSNAVTGADGYTGDPLYDARLEGMEVIMTHPEVEELPGYSNKDPDGNSIMSSSTANLYNKLGHATHGFFYATRDFLETAALKYEQLEEGQMYRYSGINGNSFVENTLDFFTGGNYTEEDFNKFKDQLVDVVFELAEQLKNGEELDFSKVESTLTVAGVDTTLGEILEFQKAGYDMESVLFGNTPSYAEIGMVESMANAFGSDKGELGQMFADAMGDLCDKALNEREDMSNNWENMNLPTDILAYKKDEHKQYTAITEAYSKLDTSSKESLEASFKEAQKEHEAILKQFDAKYGISGSMDYDAELKAAAETFNKLMEMFDEEPENHYLR